MPFILFSNHTASVLMCHCLGPIKGSMLETPKLPKMWPNWCIKFAYCSVLCFIYFLMPNSPICVHNCWTIAERKSSCGHVCDVYVVLKTPLIIQCWHSIGIVNFVILITKIERTVQCPSHQTLCISLNKSMNHSTVWDMKVFQWERIARLRCANGEHSAWWNNKGFTHSKWNCILGA